MVKLRTKLRWSLLAGLTTALVGLLIWQPAADAKGPVDLIKIARADGSSAIGIRDAASLATFTPWGETFFAAKLDDAPAVETGYAVTFFLSTTRCRDGASSCELVTSLQPIYAFDYYPSVEANGGYIYLPESGPGRTLNSGTILRPEGWYAASEDWNTIAQANLPPDAPAGQSALVLIGSVFVVVVTGLVGVGLIARSRQRARSVSEVGSV